MTEDGDDPILHKCETCGEKYLTERQLRAHQSKHSNYFENLRDENDNDDDD